MTHDTWSENLMTLTPRQIDAYLARVGLPRPQEADLGFLRALHRAHLLTFSFEALDAFMGWRSGFTPAAAFGKMVEGRRGGWCFEMNGLFGEVLAGLGYRVTRLCCGVNREILGDLAIGNHLSLRVDLDQPWLAEVGVADAIIAPVPLVVGPIRQRGFDFSITPADGGWLRFNNHARGIAKSFDFRPDHQNEAALIAAHGWLMQDPASPFTGALAVLRHTETGYVALHNDRLRRVSATEDSEQRLTSADQLAEVLDTVFDLDVPQVARVWDRIREVTQAQAA